MKENEKIMIAQDWVRQLANGINPLDGNALKNDDIVNNVHISRCLFYVADMLGKYSEGTKKTDTSESIPLVASGIQTDKYSYVDAISLSAFAKEVGKLTPKNMQEVSYKAIVQWLTQEGMLVETKPDSKGRTFKIATEKGSAIGIYCEQRENNGGKYLVTLYNRDAQRFLLEHLEEISLVK